MITPRLKLTWLAEMESKGRLFSFLERQKNISAYCFPNETYLGALYRQLTTVKDLTEKDKSILEIIKIVVDTESLS